MMVLVMGLVMGLVTRVLKRGCYRAHLMMVIGFMCGVNAM